MNATADDYRWLDDEPYEGWVQSGYCLAAIAGRTARDAMEALGGTPRGTAAGLEALSDLAFGQWEEPDAGDALLAGFCDVDGGALMVEVNGFLGVTEELMRPLSAESEIVAHFSNVNAVDRFLWWRHGTVRVDFEPLLGSVATPPDDATRAQILDCGLWLDETDESGWDELKPRVFALAERLSGIRVTPGLLEGELLVAKVSLPA